MTRGMELGALKSSSHVLVPAPICEWIRALAVDLKFPKGAGPTLTDRRPTAV